MQIVRFEQFLEKESAEIQAGFVAAAIHPSSEVHLCTINGHTCAVGTIIPLGGQGARVEPVLRLPPEIDGGVNDYLWALGPLCLVLYEACDLLVPPGPRVPITRRARVAEASIPTARANAFPVIRLSFQGRSDAMISFKRGGDAQDLTLLVVGIMYGDRRVDPRATNFELFTDMDERTWWNGGGAAPLIATAAPLDAELAAETVYIGGAATEAFDELAIFIWGPAGGGDAFVRAKAFGER